MVNDINKAASAPGTDAPPPVILCVDDEANILAALRRVFRPLGYQVLVAESGKEALQILEQGGQVDLVISDMRMPEMDGARFLAEVRRRWPEIVRMLLTGYADMESTVAAINEGQIYRHISKPWNEDELLITVRGALERRVLEQEKRRLERLTAEQNLELKRLNAGLEEKVSERTRLCSPTKSSSRVSSLRYSSSRTCWSSERGIWPGTLAGWPISRARSPAR
jgi:response regulator RpfG family c-di-GMP phosphodiesterase